MTMARPRLVAPAVLCLWAAAALAQPPTALDQEVPFYPGRTNITVCTTPFTPSEWVACARNVAGAFQGARYAGGLACMGSGMRGSEARRALHQQFFSPPAVVICDEAQDPTTFSGYEIELFRATHPRLGWTEEMLVWRCLPFDDAVAQV